MSKKHVIENHELGRFVTTNKLDLCDAETAAEDVQYFLWHARDVFKAFGEQDFEPNFMRSVSTLSGRALEHVAETNAETSRKYISGLRQQIDKADEGLDPSVNIVEAGLRHPDSELAP